MRRVTQTRGRDQEGDEECIAYTFNISLLMGGKVDFFILFIYFYYFSFVCVCVCVCVMW